jgi:hypothetical protein
MTSVKLSFTGDSVTLTLDDAAGVHTVTAGLGQWRTGTTTLFQNSIVRSLPSEGALVRDGLPYAAYAAWTGDKTLTLRLCLIETPFTPTVVCDFVGDASIRVAVQGRIGFGPVERPELVGRVD